MPEYVRRHFRYRLPDGSRGEKTVYGLTAKEADRKKRDFLRDVDLGLRMAEQGLTLKAFADQWLSTYKRGHVAPHTYGIYERDLGLLCAALGRVKLRAVTQADLQAALNARAGLSGSVLRKYRGAIRAVFKAAVVNRLISYNPAEGLVLPPCEDGTHRALEPDERARVERVARSHRFGLQAMLMLYAGLRKGEAAAFDVKRDVEGDTLRIRWSVQWTNNQPRLKAPKTRAGSRDVPVFPQLRPFLKGSQEPPTLQAFERGYESFLVAYGDDLNGFTKRWKGGREYVQPDIRCHDLRHTYATMLYEAGVDVKTAQRWLGHTSLDMTLRLYTHLSDRQEGKALKRAMNYFGDRTGDKPKRYRLKKP